MQIKLINLFLIGSISSQLFANDLNSTNNERMQINNQALEYESRKNTGQSLDVSRVYEESSLIDLNNQKKDEGQFNYTEVIYEHFKAYQRLPKKQNITQQANLVNAGYDFYAQNVETQTKEAEQQALAIQNAQQQAIMPDIKFLQGYCSLRNEVQIERIAGYATLMCDFMDYGSGLLAVSLTPDFFSQALIATPLYAEIQGKKMQVQQGVVLNGIRTSINVATSVNDYKIQKIVAASGIATASVATRYAQDYLDQLKQSRTKQTSNVIQTTGGAVVTQDRNTEKPHAGDYIAGAVVELVSSIASIVGNAYLDSIGYTFKIDKNTLMYADMQVDFNSKGMRGINFAPENMIQVDEPRFTGNVDSTSNGSDRNIAKQVPLNIYDGGIQSQENINIPSQRYIPQQQQQQMQPMMMPYYYPQQQQQQYINNSQSPTILLNNNNNGRVLR